MSSTDPRAHPALAICFIFPAAFAASVLAAGPLAHPNHDGGQPDEAPPAEHVHAPDAYDTGDGGQRQGRIEIVERDGYRHITANGLPDHGTGAFPSRGNPNAIREQRYRFRITLTPEANEAPTPSAGRPFGIALNGVLFDPFTAGFWNDDPDSGWREAADPRKRPLGIDANAAHVQPNGAYHYHGIPPTLVALQDNMTHVGWAADGFPIYGPFAYAAATDASSELVRLRPSYRVKAGSRPESAPPGDYDGAYEEDHEYIAGLGDLDECNGRFGVTPEFPDGTYYYVLTDDYPWVPRQFRGTPDPSFDIRGHDRRDGRDRRPDADRRPQRPGRGAPPRPRHRDSRMR